jgi:N-methylhydantoinase B
MYPILIEERRIAIDSMGFGQWNGAPATGGSYRSLTGDMVVYYVGDGGTFPAKGVLGGGPGASCGSWKRHANGEIERLPDFHQETVAHGEAMHYRSCAGGGYGDPLKREPERVVADVNCRWLSVERAETVFGVALTAGANGIDYVVDGPRTEQLRARRRPSRASA